MELKTTGVVDFARSPISKAKKGALNAVSPLELASQVLKALLERNPKLPKDRVEMVVCGTAYPEGEQGLNVGRQIAIKSGLPNSVAGITVNQFCASSQQAVMMISDALACPTSKAIAFIGRRCDCNRLPFINAATFTHRTTFR